MPARMVPFFPFLAVLEIVYLSTSARKGYPSAKIGDLYDTILSIFCRHLNKYLTYASYPKPKHAFL